MMIGRRLWLMGMVAIVVEIDAAAEAEALKRAPIRPLRRLLALLWNRILNGGGVASSMVCGSGGDGGRTSTYY